MVDKPKRIKCTDKTLKGKPCPRWEVAGGRCGIHPVLEKMNSFIDQKLEKEADEKAKPVMKRSKIEGKKPVLHFENDVVELSVVEHDRKPGTTVMILNQRSLKDKIILWFSSLKNKIF